MTLQELCEKLLVQYDVDLLVEELQISAQDILDRFEDKIELHFHKLHEAVEDDE